MDRHYAAITIQTKYRQFQDYLSYQLLLMETIPAVTLIQRHWRGYICRRAYVGAIDAVIVLQSFTRGAVLVRKSLLGSMNDAATCIQKVWRGFWVQLHYQLDLLDIVAVQCWARRKQALRLATLKSNSVAMLQRAARRHLARLAILKQKRELRAAILIEVSLFCHFSKTFSSIAFSCSLANVLKCSRWLADTLQPKKLAGDEG